MFSDELKRLYRQRAVKDAAISASWVGVFVACLFWYGHGEGWFAGGMIKDHAWEAALLGYLLGAFFGAGGVMGSYSDESYNYRERRLRELDERVDDDQEFLESEMRRMKREALLWNPFVWPFALLYGIILALRPIPQPRSSLD